MKLHINHFCYKPTLDVKHSATLSKTAVSAKAVEAIVNGFNAPDIADVTIFYNEHRMHINPATGFDKKAFAQWWKLRKLGL